MVVNDTADNLELGLVVVKLGRSSVTYRIGIFVKQDAQTKGSRDPRACAVVDFTHVYVHPQTRKSIAMSEAARVGLRRVSRLDLKDSKL